MQFLVKTLHNKVLHESNDRYNNENYKKKNGKKLYNNPFVIPYTTLRV